MNNIPENNNVTEPEVNVTETSTIFSNPEEHSKKASDVKGKKYLPVILASVMVVAILIGSVVAIIKFIPEKTDNESNTSVIEDIEVLSAQSTDFKSCVITNSNGTFNFLKKANAEDDAEEEWYIEGYEEGILSSLDITYVVDSLASIYASREITELSEQECGLDKPSVTIEVCDNKDKKFNLFLGRESPDESGYYLKISTSGKIYVVGYDLYETLNFTDVSLANTNILPAFDITNIKADYLGDDGLLSSCDKLILSGKNFTTPLVIEPNFDEMVAVYAAFNITSPQKRAAENVEGVFEIFKSGVTVEGAYALDKTGASLKKFGLDKPDLTAKMEIDGRQLTFKFKLQADGYYAAVCDTDPIIKKVNAEAIPFIDYKTSDYYSEWVCLNGIDNLKEFSITVDGQTHKFAIKVNPAEESEQLYFINYKGRELESPDFQEFYKSCIALTCSDFTTDNLTKQPTISYEFTYNDDIGGSQKVEFVRFSETKYQFYVDGTAMGKVNASSLRKIENALKELIAE